MSSRWATGWKGNLSSDKMSFAALPEAAGIGSCLLVALICTFVVPTALCTEAPRVYYIGDCMPRTSPINIIADDPALDVVAVPAVIGRVWWTKEEVSRAIRLYLPKSYEELVSRKMLALLSDVYAENLPNKYIQWFSTAVEQDGMSLMMIGGICTFGGNPAHPSLWGSTSVGAVLPVEPILGANGPGPWRPVVTSPDDPLMRAFDWSRCPPFYGYNVVELKQGARLLAKTSNTGDPFMAFWDLGAGRAFAFCTDWTPAWGADFQRWDYYIDFTVYSIYHALGRSIPSDLQLVHAIRSRMLSSRARRDMLFSLFNMVEALGGKVVQLERRMEGVERLRSEVDLQYLDQDYEACMNTLTRVEAELREIELGAIREKARALFWIWAVEWIVVTATLMLAGTLLWSLMIRRRLYREVGVTRSR